ncbi:MAG: phasin family protein [candidate division Zixibacteria bacterium]
MDIFKKLALASLGAIDITKEKIEEMFDEMVKRGEMTEDEKATAVRNFVEKSSDSADKIKEKVEDIFSRCAEKCTSKVTDQLSAMGKRTEELAGRIEELEKKLSKK